MSNGALKVILHATRGRGGTHEFPVQAIEGYMFDGSMDTDADSFSIDIGDPFGRLGICTERDTEVRCTIFNRDGRNRLIPEFTGFADTAQYESTDHVLSIKGRDSSVLALGDAAPGRWQHVQPAIFIKQQALKLGMQVNRIHRMAEISTLYTDGTETDWAFWYRMIRQRGMFMWTEPLGGLVIDHLGYSLTPAYYFGVPEKGSHRGQWVMPDETAIISSKDRDGQVWVYAQDDKTGRAFATRGIDTSIRAWRKKPIHIISSSTAKSQADAKKEADVEVFESIVGKQEIQLTLNDVGMRYRQNKMCRVNLPDEEIVGDFYVVGVTSRGGGEGKSQVLRLREKGFALSKRVPDDPIIAKDPASQVITSQVGSAVKLAGVRWGDSFVRATNEFKDGWDTAVFLGVLLSICKQESGFKNVAEQRHDEWMSLDDWIKRTDWIGIKPHQSVNPNAARHTWELAFANAQSNPLNPRHPSSEAGVGPMQLTTPVYKQWADQYGWDTGPKVGEYDGGRWNPDSNIRAAARALAGKGAIAPVVDPTKADNIWILVSRYHGSTDESNNKAYVASVKSIYKNEYGSIASAAIAAASTKNTGTERSYQIGGYGVIKLPGGTPDAVVKALNFCMNRRGDRYQWGGAGPLYDCSSFVTAAYAQADPNLKAILDEPRDGRHGEDTYSLWKPGRFQDIMREHLLPGDLVFFNHGANTPEHVGMYIEKNLFVHDSNSSAPPRGGVKISVLTEEYYADRFMGARRLVTWLNPHPVP